MLLKNRKNNKSHNYAGGPYAKNRPAACLVASSWARSPTANGRATELARRGVSLPRPRGPLAGPRTGRDPGRRF